MQKIDKVLKVVSMEPVETTDTENKIPFQKVKSFYPKGIVDSTHTKEYQEVMTTSL